MSKSETIRCLLIGDLRRIFLISDGATLPGSTAGREDLDLLLRLHAVSPNAAEKKMQFEVGGSRALDAQSEADIYSTAHRPCHPRRVRLSREGFAT